MTNQINQIDADTLADRFNLCEPDVVDWAMGIATAGLKEQIDAGLAIAQQWSSTLTLLLGATVASLAVAAGLVDSPQAASASTWGAAAMGCYLFALCSFTVLRGSAFRDAPSAYNLPSNLLHPGHSLSATKPGELAAMQLRIEDLRSLNIRRAKLVNRVRAAALGAPCLFVVTSLLAKLARSC